MCAEWNSLPWNRSKQLCLQARYSMVGRGSFGLLGGHGRESSQMYCRGYIVHWPELFQQEVTCGITHGGGGVVSTMGEMDDPL